MEIVVRKLALIGRLDIFRDGFMSTWDKKSPFQRVEIYSSIPSQAKPPRFLIKKSKNSLIRE